MSLESSYTQERLGSATKFPPPGYTCTGLLSEAHRSPEHRVAITITLMHHSDASTFRVDSKGRKCAINSFRVTMQIIHALIMRDDLRGLLVLHQAEPHVDGTWSFEVFGGKNQTSFNRIALKRELHSGAKCTLRVNFTGVKPER
jgi:hypothetical protein